MTLAEIAGMTPDERRVKCAEACGWTSIEDRSGPLMMTPLTYVYGYPPKGAIIGDKATIPHYDHDLSDCAEMEATLTDEEWPNYVDMILGAGSFCIYDAVKHALTRTPVQRVTAFLAVKPEQ